MRSTTATVSDVIHAHYDALTRSEKRLAESLLGNYPVSGLGSITTIAENAGVSTPTVARMVQKLGYKGYPEFQAHLHQELEATISGPIAKHDRWATNAPGLHILNRFADAITGNLRDTLSDLDTAVFDNAAALLSDRKRSIYFVGGRITGALTTLARSVASVASGEPRLPQEALTIAEAETVRRALNDGADLLAARECGSLGS